jgi:hypothetical protein
MGLSDDQRAMLRLLAQRGEQGYEDIAALKGLTVEQVRAQVAQALAQLDEEGVLAPEAAAAAEPAAPDPKPAPAAKPEPKPAPTPRPRAPKRGAPQLKPPSGGGLRAAIAAGLAVLALIAIILIVSGGGEDESTGSPPATGAESSAGTGAAAVNAGSNSEEVTKAFLEPVDGSDAKGVAIFGKVEEGKKEKLALEIAVEGLEATGKDASYTVWLAASPQRMLPLASTEVGANGKIAGQYEIPVEVLGFLANETFKELALTKTDNPTLEAAVSKAAKEKKSPDYTGEEVLRGEITGPVVGAQLRQEAEKEGE